MTLLKCPECRGSLSDTATACPHCGFATNPAMLKSLRAQQEKTVNAVQNTFIVGGLAFMATVILCTVVAVNSSSTSDSSASGASASPTNTSFTPSTAQTMAALEADSLSGAHDQRLTSSMDRRLRSLARKFPETEKQIADMTVKTRELLANKGIHKSLGQVMDDIDYILPSGELGISYAECAAMYVTLAGH